MNIAKEIGERGAYKMSYIMVRLNEQIADVFSEWVKKAYPDVKFTLMNASRLEFSENNFDIVITFALVIPFLNFLSKKGTVCSYFMGLSLVRAFASSQGAHLPSLGKTMCFFKEK